MFSDNEVFVLSDFYYYFTIFIHILFKYPWVDTWVPCQNVYKLKGLQEKRSQVKRSPVKKSAKI